MTRKHHDLHPDRAAAVDRRIEAFYVAEARMSLVRRGPRASAGVSRPR